MSRSSGAKEDSRVRYERRDRPGYDHDGVQRGHLRQDATTGPRDMQAIVLREGPIDPTPFLLAVTHRWEVSKIIIEYSD